MAMAQNSIYMFRKSVPQRFAPSCGAFGVSFVLHCSLAFLLFHASQVFYAAPRTEAVVTPPAKIYYIVPILQASKTLPRMIIKAQTEITRSSPPPSQPAESKGITFPENLAVVSRPRNPDNTHQTILQPNAPNIRIKTDLSLPNVIMEMAKGAALRAPIDGANARPLPHQARLIDQVAPAIASKFDDSTKLSIAANSQAPLPMPDAPSASRIIRKRQDSRVVDAPILPNAAAMPDGSAAVASGPSAQLPAPSVSTAKPVRVQVASAEAGEIPAITGAPEIRFSQAAPSASSAQLPSPAVSVARPTQRIASRVDAGSAPVVEGAPAANVSQANAFGSQTQLALPSVVVARPLAGAQKEGTPSGTVSPPNPGDLVIIGVHPSAATSQIILPPGTRLGTFVIAPASGGTPSGSAHKSNNAAGSAGGSISAHAGAGAKSSSGLDLTVGKGSDKPEASGALKPPLPPDMVFPVPPDSLVRKNRMVVATGPTGGGGLGIYRVLNCGKIFTIFLPMPGKNWTMQYCATPSASANSASSSNVAIQWGERIVPPEPKTKFDFRRLPVPSDKPDKMIVLRGMLRADGTVTKLTIYRGIAPQMDEAARLAFGRWKFKPALLHGVPVPVELLIGIPVRP